jgi:hypothetical protein
VEDRKGAEGGYRDVSCFIKVPTLGEPYPSGPTEVDAGRERGNEFSNLYTTTIGTEFSNLYTTTTAHTHTHTHTLAHTHTAASSGSARKRAERKGGRTFIIGRAEAWLLFREFKKRL